MSEKKQKRSREDIAKIEIGKTEISQALTITICAFFLALIVGYPMLQAGYEITTGKRLVPQALDIFPSLCKPLIQKDKDNLFNNLVSANGDLVSKINHYEDELEDNALLREYLLPPAQKTLLDVFKTGNEKAFVGNDGFLFFQSGVKYLTNPGFLTPSSLKKRIAKAKVQPDPRKAIIQFKEQLAKRNVKLIIIPTTVKPMIYPDKFSPIFRDFSGYLQNSSFVKFKQEMEKAGVLVFDPASILADARKQGNEVFLKTDTHWTPYGMQCVATELSSFIASHIKLSARENIDYGITPRNVTALGDVALMLKLSDPENFFAKQKVMIEEVTQGKTVFRPNRNSEILLLGDSFTNIFSLEAMGWGANAGFAEHLAFELKRSIDTIVRNDAGAYATREILDNELKKGRDRLAGKQLVIWQFAIRELVDGDWKLLKMELGKAVPATFFVPEPGIPVKVKATVLESSLVPRPGSVPYKDHVMSLHLINISGIPSLKKAQSLVYIQSMKDGKLTSAARLRSNQTVHIKLYNWQNMENKYGGLNRSDLENEDITLEDPCWGELINEK